MDTQMNGSYLAKFDDGDLQYDFDGDEFGTDFVHSPLDLSSLKRILEFYENIPYICNDQDAHKNSKATNKTGQMKRDCRANSVLSYEEKNADILSSAFTFAMQCSPASSIASEDSLDNAAVNLQESRSPNIDIPQCAELLSPQYNAEKQALFDASSPDSGVSEMDYSPEILLHEEPEVEIVYEKPNITYLELVARAIMSTTKEQAALQEIYEYIMSTYPYFRTAKPAWKVSVRHNLSTNECFVKMGRVQCNRGYFWGIHPLCREEFLKQNFNSTFIRKRIKMAMSKNKATTKSQQNSTMATANLAETHSGKSSGSNSDVTASRVPMNIVYPCESTQELADQKPVPKYYKQQVYVQTTPMSHDVTRQQQYHMEHSGALNQPQSFTVPQYFCSKQRTEPNVIRVRNCNFISL